MLAKASLRILVVALAASIALTASSARGAAAPAPSSAFPVGADAGGRRPSVRPPAAHADPQPSLGATSMSANGMPADPQSTLSALHANPRTPGGADGAGQTKMDGFHAMVSTQ